MSARLTKCCNPFCGHSDANAAFRDIKGDGGRVCPKCFVEQGDPVHIPDHHRRCARCLVVRPEREFEKIITCKDGDYLLKCRICGYDNK